MSTKTKLKSTAAERVNISVTEAEKAISSLPCLWYPRCIFQSWKSCAISTTKILFVRTLYILDTINFVS